MNTKAIPILLILTMALAVGCSAPTLRFAPAEEVKQASTGASQLAAQLVATGAAPGDPGIVELSKLTRPGATYAGPPDVLLNVDPFAQAARGKWEALQMKNTMYELRDRWSRKISEAVSAKVTALATKITDVSEGKTVPRVEVVTELSALQDVTGLALEFTDEIKIPEGPKTSQELLDQIAKVQADSMDMLHAANKAAAMRPSGKDVADEVVNQTNGVLDYAGELIEDNPGLSTLLGLAGLGGGGTWLRTRSKRRREADIEGAKAEERKDQETSTLRAEVAALGILRKQENA